MSEKPRAITGHELSKISHYASLQLTSLIKDIKPLIEKQENEDMKQLLEDALEDYERVMTLIDDIADGVVYAGFDDVEW